MPNCFCLQRKFDPEHKNVQFVKIDEEMCAAFGVTPDPIKYYRGWYDMKFFWTGFYPWPRAEHPIVPGSLPTCFYRVLWLEEV